MTPTHLSWELYHSFLAVVRERSLSGAARAVGLTQPTVGRHIDLLEEALGVSLFARSRTGLIPSIAAQELVPHAEAMASAANAIARIASGDAQAERGAVRITASEMIGTEVLPAALAAFRRAHPSIEVELVISNRSQDLLRREADIAVRMVKPKQGALTAKKLGSVHLALHAHPSYVKAHGTPRSLAELRGHPLIGFDSAASIASFPKLEIPLTRDMFAFRCDSDVGQYAALRAGFGIGMCQIGLGKRDQLVPILPSSLRIELGVWVVMHQDLKHTLRMRLMFAHLAAHLQAYIASE